MRKKIGIVVCLFLLATLSVSVSAATPSTPIGAPVACAPNSDTLCIFYQTSDALVMRLWDSNGWHPATTLPPLQATSPCAVAIGSSQMQVFCRGPDNALWTTTAYYDTNLVTSPMYWSSWTRIGGLLNGGPGAIWNGGNSVVFVRGTDNQLWEGSRIDAAHPNTFMWKSLGGVLAGSPVATHTGERTTIYCPGTDGHPYAYVSGAWQRMSGQVLNTANGNLAVCSNGALFVVGTDHHVYRWHNSAWESWGGYTSAIGAASRGSVVTAFATGSGVIWQNEGNLGWKAI